MFFRKQAGITWIIAFLGNPGSEYSFTRHNAGFITAEAMSKQTGTAISRARFKALVGTCDISGEKVLLMKPQTYMNSSGDSVREAVSFYKIPPDHVIIVSDEMSLPVGTIRIKPKGSAGGHNGLKSIISALGTDAFPRIRLGIGFPPNPDYDIKDWVLSVFHDQDAEEIQNAAARAAEAAACYISCGAEKAMNRYNTKKNI